MENNKISPSQISVLSETMLIPLWAKAVEYGRPDALLTDAEAARMKEMIDYDFGKFAGVKASQAGCCGRAALIDDEVRRFLESHPDGVVVQLGAGLDARYERLGRPKLTAWYDWICRTYWICGACCCPNRAIIIWPARCLTRIGRGRRRHTASRCCWCRKGC